jgi:hypothetical protein
MLCNVNVLLHRPFSQLLYKLVVLFKLFVVKTLLGVFLVGTDPFVGILDVLHLEGVVNFIEGVAHAAI